MFRFFRRYQKSIIVVGGVILMFVFLVGDYIGSSFSGPSTGSQVSPNATFATWNGGKLTNAEFEAEYDKRRILDAFLRRVYETGFTRAMGREMDLPTLGVKEIGFLNSREGVSADQLRRQVLFDVILAEEAREHGMGISKEVLEGYIAKIGYSELSSNDLRAVLSTIRATVSSDYILDALEDAFLADMMREVYGISSAGLLATEMPIDRWRAWRQVNDLVAVEAAALKVDSFASEVPAPTEQQLRALYDEFKDVVPAPHQVGGVRLPNPDPAFAIPRKVKLQYLQADFDGAIEKFKAEITDEEIKKYYEENKGLFRKASPLDLFGPLPEEGPAEAPEGAAAEGEAPEGDSPATPGTEVTEADPTSPATDAAPPEAPTPDGTSDEPATETPAETPDEPAVEPTPGDQPAGETPADEPTAAEEPAGEAPPADEPTSEPQALRGGVGEVQFVNFQPEGGETPATEEPAAEDQPATEEPSPEDQPAADEQPAVTQQPPGTEETPAEGEAPATGEGTPSEGTGTEAAGEEAPAGETPEGATPGEEQPEEEFSPLEEVADEIREQIARARADEQLAPALDAAMERLQIAAREYRREILALPEDAPRPAPPATLSDLSTLAAEFNLIYEETKELDVYELSETEIGSAVDPDSPVMRNGQLVGYKAVYEIAFEEGTTNLYRPFTPRSMSDRYIVMKISDTPRRVPPYDEVKSVVREAWIHREAVKLAKQRAEEFAAKASEAGQPLTEFFAGDEKVEVTETPAFSWLTQGETASPEQGPNYRMSQPFGVTNVGPEFMETVFNLRGSDVKATLNHDESIAYVVRIASEIETEESLRNTFLANANAWDGRFYFRQGMLQQRQSFISQTLQEELDIETPGLEAAAADEDQAE